MGPILRVAKGFMTFKGRGCEPRDTVVLQKLAHMCKASEIYFMGGDMFVTVAPMFMIANVYGTYTLFLIFKPAVS
jgi:hypothetical protein